jgi:hypothetical protein
MNHSKEDDDQFVSWIVFGITVILLIAIGYVSLFWK